ncbi:MAG: YkvA family protein [Spirochaetia bacterium]|nr:YkvA family protein [Spirochaetia bacterium]
MAENFDENGYWDKIKKFGKQAGKEVIEKSLWLYYALQEPETPAWAKTVIYGALAYFILPADAIPDTIPVVGFIDDLGALAAAVSTVALYINDNVKEKAAKKLSDWFE